MNTRWYRLALCLTFVEGFIAIFLVFASPSEAKSAWLLGFSKARLLTGALMLAGLFLAGAAALLSFLRKDWFTTQIRKLEAYLLRGENHAIVVLGLVSTLIVCVVLLVIRAMAPPDAGMLVSCR